MEKVKEIVNVAYSIMERYSEMADKGLMQDDSARIAAWRTIEALKYQGNNYVWINDKNNVFLAHARTELIGKDMSNETDQKGFKFITDLTQQCMQKGEGFIEYYWLNPEKNAAMPKLSYGKLFKKWNNIIASGLWIDQIDENVATIRNQVLLSMLVIIILSVLASLFVARSITKPIGFAVDAAKAIADGEFDKAGEAFKKYRRA
jgi:methyl-accepting chemotaxis protein